MKKYPTVTIRIDQDLLDRIDRLADNLDVSRSYLIKGLIEQALHLHATERTYTT